ncbi:MAG: AmmeMemoRadiSam system protein B, partial [Myxococcota bacterium]
MSRVRKPAVAGSFYPNDPDELRGLVEAYLRAATPPADLPARPKALIVPHAGYVYSGPVAATAYAALRGAAEEVRRVVLLGPSHRVVLRGLATSSADRFATPLGDVPVDREAVELALGLTQVHALDAAHRAEHSLEVHLPFLQVVLGEFRLVPFSVGDATPEEVAEVLTLLWGDAETLVVISTDLSHYYDYETALRLDAATT